MSDMQRYSPTWTGKPERGMTEDDGGNWVLASDAEAAIAAAEQRGMDMMRQPDPGIPHGEAYARAEGYQQGQRDMLARAIEAVDAIGVDGDPRPVMTVMQGHYIKRDDALSALAALRALGGNDD